MSVSHPHRPDPTAAPVPDAPEALDFAQQERVADLVAVYSRAALNMRDLPVYNPALSVAATGFMRAPKLFPKGHLVGALITPWFMNVVLLPETKWDDGTPGQEMRRILPSGQYTFVVNRDDGLGRYETCSLFSPMNEFQTQEHALAVAEAAVQFICGSADTLRQVHENEEGAEPNSIPSSDADGRDTPEKAEKGSKAADLNRRGFLMGGGAAKARGGRS